MGWYEQSEGKECFRCGARRGLFVVVRCHARPVLVIPYLGWYYWKRATCLDPVACEERRLRKREMARARSGAFVLALPEFPDAPRGQCRWCGDMLIVERPARRNYCFPDREGKDCRGEADRAIVYDPRLALMRTQPRPLCCVDCGVECERGFDADHEVPIWKGGEHTLENLRVRCTTCHKAKTRREAGERAAARRAA